MRIISLVPFSEGWQYLNAFQHDHGRENYRIAALSLGHTERTSLNADRSQLSLDNSLTDVSRYLLHCLPSKLRNESVVQTDEWLRHMRDITPHVLPILLNQIPRSKFPSLKSLASPE